MRWSRPGSPILLKRKHIDADLRITLQLRSLSEVRFLVLCDCLWHIYTANLLQNVRVDLLATRKKQQRDRRQSLVYFTDRQCVSWHGKLVFLLTSQGSFTFIAIWLATKIHTKVFGPFWNVGVRGKCGFIFVVEKAAIRNRRHSTCGHIYISFGHVENQESLIFEGGRFWLSQECAKLLIAQLGIRDAKSVLQNRFRQWNIPVSEILGINVTGNREQSTVP